MKTPMKTFTHHPAFLKIEIPRILLCAMFAVMFIADVAPAQTTLTLVATNLFGGSGDQRATAASIANGALYFSGVTAANSGDGLAVSYALPMTNNAAPVWSATWPGLAGSDEFNGISVSTSGVYVAGSSYGRTTDRSEKR